VSPCTANRLDWRTMSISNCDRLKIVPMKYRQGRPCNSHAQVLGSCATKPSA
jgi:hypothetical protein